MGRTGVEGHRDEFRVRARRRATHGRRSEAAHLCPSRAALVAVAAAEVVVHHHRLPSHSSATADAHLGDHTRWFVPTDDRSCSAGTSVDVEVGTAHAGRVHGDDDLVGRWEQGHRWCVTRAPAHRETEQPASGHSFLPIGGL